MISLDLSDTFIDRHIRFVISGMNSALDITVFTNYAGLKGLQYINANKYNVPSIMQTSQSLYESFPKSENQKMRKISIRIETKKRK